MTRKTLWGPFALALALSAAACDEYESPGAVAGEGVWSHVPAEAMDEQVAPVRQRMRQLENLQSRQDSVERLLRQAEARIDDAPLEEPRPERQAASLRARLGDLEADLNRLSALQDQPAAFRALRQSLLRDLEELSADVADLYGRTGSPPAG
jgi:chromosome segregation ATPase